MKKNKMWALLSGLVLASMILAACTPQTVNVPVTVVVKETQKVVETQVVTVKETEVVTVKETQIVTAPGTEKGSFTTPHPILGDVRVRQAIAYCYIPTEVISSVYPFLSPEDQLKLLMPTNIPQSSWAFYGGPEVIRYFDPANPAAGPEKAKKLLDEAGWTLAEDADFRTNANGDELGLKFTTTSAEFRKTWAAVFEQQLAKNCGMRILRLHAPASWWFGATTGTRRRDFELGAFAWVGENDPKGATLYACNQIPFPENGWQGQNYMGWCNQTASDAINAANNTLDKAERIKQYKIFQIEFAKDMVSLPMFQRAEGNAATSRLKNFKPSATEYYTWNAWEWELTDGADTMVLALSQEPDSMYSLVSNMAAQRTVAWLVYEQSASQYNWDFQPWQMAELPTVDSGRTKVAEVEVKEGDAVVDYAGTPVDADGKLLTLVKGLKIKTSDGKEVEYAGGAVKMNQMTVSYKFVDGLKWSDGQPVVKADFELAYKNDCDPASGAVDYSTCQSIQKVEFTSDTEFTVTFKPGFAGYLQTIYSPIGYYPSHQVIQTDGPNKGKKLAEVPTADWASLPEVSEVPLGTGPYMVKSWEKGVKLELEANPYYWRGPVKIKNIIVLIVADTNQAVSQLLTGDVDVIGAETLGAGAEVQTVIEAEKSGKPIQVLIEASATWEHTDMQLFLP